MKITIVTLGCLLLAQLAFAQPSSTNKKQTTTEPVTVTGAIIKMTTEEGAAASYQPIRTLVIREDNSNERGALCSQRTWTRCEQRRPSHPNCDQTRRPRACLLRKHQRSAYD